MKTVTVKEWNEIIEKYFNKKNIKYDRNYLYFFPEINIMNLLFERKTLYNINKGFKGSIVILFKKDEVEIFSCDVKLEIFSGMQLTNIGKMRQTILRKDIKTLKLSKGITKYKLYFETNAENKNYRIDKFPGFNKSWIIENIRYLVENKLVEF